MFNATMNINEVAGIKLAPSWNSCHKPTPNIACTGISCPYLSDI